MCVYVYVCVCEKLLKANTSVHVPLCVLSILFYFGLLFVSIFCIFSAPVCVCLSMSMSVSVTLPASASTSVSMFMSVSMSASVSISAYVSMSVDLSSVQARIVHKSKGIWVGYD